MSETNEMAPATTVADRCTCGHGRSLHSGGAGMCALAVPDCDCMVFEDAGLPQFPAIKTYRALVCAACDGTGHLPRDPWQQRRVCPECNGQRLLRIGIPVAHTGEPEHSA